MFDLNEAIGRWRENVIKVSIISGQDLDELESHLRDHIEQLRQEGLTSEEAFNRAIRQIGKVDEIDREFSKVSEDKVGFLAFADGRNLIMSNFDVQRQQKSTWLLLFVSFSSFITWLGTTWFLLYGTKFSGAGIWRAIIAVGHSLLSTSFFLILAIIALTYGMRCLRQVEKKAKFIWFSAIPSIILTPLLIIAGIALILLVPMAVGHVKGLVVGFDIAQSVISPNGNFEAFVVNKPSIDPPNQHLYLRQLNILGRKNGKGYNRKIAQLPEDVDRMERIHWSSYSDVVVFQSYFSLIAVSVPNYGMVKIPLGGREHWRDNGTFWVDYEDVKRVKAIEFPEPGAFSYQVEGSEESRVVQISPL